MQNRLRELRKAAGFRQADLAARAGISQATLSQLENGNLPFTLNYMRIIGSILGCAPADFLTPDDNPDRLSSEERRLIVLLRTAGHEQRALVARLIEPIDAPDAKSDDDGTP